VFYQSCLSKLYSHLYSCQQKDIKNAEYDNLFIYEINIKKSFFGYIDINIKKMYDVFGFKEWIFEQYSEMHSLNFLKISMKTITY